MQLDCCQCGGGGRRNGNVMECYLGDVECNVCVSVELLQN